MIQERRKKIAQESLTNEAQSKSSANNHSNNPTSHQHNTTTTPTANEDTSSIRGTKRNDTCRKGPCHFGHITTSLRSNGQVRWTTNPDPSFWPDVQVGATLCQKCYNLGWRQRNSGREQNQRLPTAINKCQDTTDHPIEATKKDGDGHSTAATDCDDTPADYHSLYAAEDQTNNELPSSSKRIRCAIRLRMGSAIRLAKSLPLHQTDIDPTPVEMRRTPCTMLHIRTGRPPDNAATNYHQTTHHPPPQPNTHPPSLVRRSSHSPPPSSAEPLTRPLTMSAQLERMYSCT
jgi:hypothetical protein